MRVTQSINFPVLILCFEEEFSIGNGEHLGHPFQLGSTEEGFLNKILPIRQHHEWLRVSLTRDWPKAATDATRKYYRDQFHI
ncbi:hypothetical protein D3C76_1365550 [compost metagenome]